MFDFHENVEERNQVNDQCPKKKLLANFKDSKLKRQDV